MICHSRFWSPSAGCRVRYYVLLCMHGMCSGYSVFYAVCPHVIYSSHLHHIPKFDSSESSDSRVFLHFTGLSMSCYTINDSLHDSTTQDKRSIWNPQSLIVRRRIVGALSSYFSKFLRLILEYIKTKLLPSLVRWEDKRNVAPRPELSALEIGKQSFGIAKYPISTIYSIDSWMRHERGMQRDFVRRQNGSAIFTRSSPNIAN